MDELVKSPAIIVGSSMGGWLGLLVALRRPDLVRAIIGVASAPDFSELLVWNSMSDSQRKELEKNNIIKFGAEVCGEGLSFTYDLIKDGRSHLLLNKQIDIDCPVRLFHGMQDLDVPFEFSIKTAELLQSKDIKVVLKKSSDHRMSSEDDLEDISLALTKIIKKVF